MAIDVDPRLQLTSIQFLIQTLDSWILNRRKYEKMDIREVAMVIHFTGQGLEFFPKYLQKKTLLLIPQFSSKTITAIG